MNLSRARTLVVGDIHAATDELLDCEALLAGISSLKKFYDVVIFLGDQFNTHSVLSLPVVDFWRRSVTELRRQGWQQIYLRGNHDMAASGRGPNALDVFRDLLGPDDIVVDNSCVVDGITFLSHQVDPQVFYDQISVLGSSNSELLICHQTFQGAQYENGIYAHDGLDQDRVPHQSILSGHIHKAASFGKVCYPGSPRWRIASDANEDKYVLGFPEGLLGAAREYHFTSQWCVPIEIHDVTVENADHLPRLWATSKASYVVRGNPEFVKSMAVQLESAGHAVKRRPDLLTSPRVSESQAIGTAIMDFMHGFRAPLGTPGVRLAQLAAQRFSG